VSSLRILLVDDEPALVRLLETFLRQRGFAVDACAGSAEALEMFAAAPQRYQLIIADINMPGLAGDAMALECAAMSGSVRILLTSGLPFSTHLFPPGIRERSAFLQKPFLPKMVMEAIERLLAGRHRAAPPTVQAE
jgi:DNA-binding response OmpR family regulator